MITSRFASCYSISELLMSGNQNDKEDFGKYLYLILSY